MVHLALLFIAAAVLLAIITYFTTVVFRINPSSTPRSDRFELKEDDIIPVSVNYFFTRHCNAECGFCFHTETSSYKLPIAEAKRGLRLLEESGMKKINFAGGEPFLYPKYLGELCQYCKVDLKLESVSIISNGTKVTEKWLKQFGPFVDILAISCDSQDPKTNAAIGRADRGSGKPFDNVAKLFQIKEWCGQNGIRFKLNTVVCSMNWEEDMVGMLQKLDLFRWKVFQVLVIVGQNESDVRKRDARKFIISDEQFNAFIQRHKDLKFMVPEPNQVMKSSYLLIDEYMRFLDKGDGAEKVSECILDVGVQKAIKQIHWDQEEFHKRGGIFDWNAAADKANTCSPLGTDKKLEW